MRSPPDSSTLDQQSRSVDAQLPSPLWLRNLDYSNHRSNHEKSGRTYTGPIHAHHITPLITDYNVYLMIIVSLIPLNPCLELVYVSTICTPSHIRDIHQIRVPIAKKENACSTALLTYYYSTDVVPCFSFFPPVKFISSVSSFG